MDKKIKLVLLASILTLGACGTSNETTETQDPDPIINPIDDPDVKTTFTIKYINENGDVLYQTEVNPGEMPKFVGDLPTKEGNEDYSYEFAGWLPRPSAATADTTYTANFNEVARGLVMDKIESEYVSYKEYAKNYLDANPTFDWNDTSDVSNVHTYLQPGEVYSPIKFSWTQNFANVESIKFIYALNEEYTDAKVIDLDKSAKSVDLYNLYKGKQYFAKIEVYTSSGVKTTKFTFNTSSVGPRVMKVDGIGNVRDIGGYDTVNGKKTLQGMIFRGTEMNGVQGHTYQLTEAGKKTMSEDMGIKLDIDLRNSSELKDRNNNNEVITTTPIPGAKIAFVAANNYDSAITNSTTMCQVMRLLSEKRNYPAYIHCWGGADRTGTISFLINALLGVDLPDLVHDYEFTSFSVNGERNAKYTISNYKFKEMYEKLCELYPDGTLQEKVEAYLLDGGLTETEIYNIKAINYGESVIKSCSVDGVYHPSLVSNLTVNVNDMDGVEKVEIDGTQVNFELNDFKIIVSQEELSSLSGGEHEIKVYYAGTQEPVKTTFTSISGKIYEVEEMFDITSSSGCVSTGSSFLKSNDPVGYGSFVRARVKTETKQNSGFYFMIGSYGVYLRGKQVRLQRIAANGTTGVNADFGVICTFPDEKLFNSGALDILLKVDVTAEGVEVTFAILNEDGSIYGGVFGKLLSSTLKLDSGEIATENAKFSFKLVSGDSTIGNSISLYGHTPKAYVDSEYEMNDFKIYLKGVDDTAKVFMNEEEVDFSYENNVITVSQIEMFKIAVGTVNGVVKLNGVDYEFTFVRKEAVPYVAEEYMFGTLEIVFPGCDDSAIVKFNSTEVEYVYEDNTFKIAETEFDKLAFGEIAVSIEFGGKTTVCSFEYKQIKVEVDELHSSTKDLVIKMSQVDDTAEVYLNSVSYDYTLDEQKNIVISKESLASLTIGEVSGKIVFKGKDYLFSFKQVVPEADVDLTATSKEFTSTKIVGYNNSSIDFDITTDTASSGNGYLVAAVGSYGINFRGGRLRFITIKKDSGFATSDFNTYVNCDAYSISESSFAAKTGHINLSYKVQDNEVTMTVKITFNNKINGYIEPGTYTFEHTFTSPSIASGNAKSIFFIDGTKQKGATIENFIINSSI